MTKFNGVASLVPSGADSYVEQQVTLPNKDLVLSGGSITVWKRQ